ncbi:hypothetical protein H4582DRAFT_1926630 [Lactarius indigo]|nr:hypothetical protein H4582DRAFT_1926630 [Lactarius indigo]
MSIAPKSFNRINNVPALPTRTFTLASTARRRNSAFTPALHPTILCVVVATTSIHLLAQYKHSEATNNTPTKLAPLLMTYSSLLFSLFGALSAALRAIPIIRIASHDQPFAFVEFPTHPSTKVIFQAQMGIGDSHTIRRPSILSWLWLPKGLWDCCTSCLRSSVGPISDPVPFLAGSVTICLRKRGMPRSPSLAVFMDVRTVVCSSRWRHHRSHSLCCDINSLTDVSHTLDGLLF